MTTTKNHKKVQQYNEIRKHGLQLQAIYPQTLALDPVALCKKLHRLEHEAHAIALRWCNGPEFDEGKREAMTERVIGKVEKLLGDGPAVFLNGDARGYALKIDTEDAKGLDIHKDWGGFGIICPEIS